MAIFGPLALFSTIIILLVDLRSLIVLASTIAVAPMIILLIALIVKGVRIITLVVFLSQPLLAHGLLATPQRASTFSLGGQLETPLRVLFLLEALLQLTVPLHFLRRKKSDYISRQI